MMRAPCVSIRRRQRDTFRTLKKGWVFWIPAASINFACAAPPRSRAGRRCPLPGLCLAADVCCALTLRRTLSPACRRRLVPLRFQVLYMSTCSIVWTTILSAASASAPPALPPLAAAGKKGGKAPAAAASPKEQKKKK